jgi:N-acetylmuramoyl-L-alanine amidase
LKDFTRSRPFGYIVALALTLILLPAIASASAFHSESWAREKFTAADHMREDLGKITGNNRTRHDYQRVIDAYRRVYLGCPTCTKADPSVLASAEVLLQMARQFDDDHLLRHAIKQYEFLRREYPGSKSRSEALFTVGQIYKDDLDEPNEARATFQEFLRHYPHSRLAHDATDAITELDEPAAAKKPPDTKNTPPKPASLSGDAGTDKKPSTYTRVTGILHWSSSDSARVAIDLEQAIQFGSERLENPSRIYFDLHDTRLASNLLGKTFDVDSALLKKIRVAQFERGRSRIVLEIGPQSEYRAFLLPNPNRLIIEIHPRKPAPKAESGEIVNRNPAQPDAAPTKVPAAVTVSQARPDQPSPENKTPAVVSSLQTKPSIIPASNPIPTRIVEADDDDEGGESRLTPKSPVAKGASSATGQKNRNQAGSSPAVAARPKRRSADGNNDEIATLTTPELTSEAPAISVPAARVLSNVSRSKPMRSASKRDRMDLDMHEAQPTMAGDRSLIRALGLKIGRIVVDPGHGGHDTGTIGPNGVEEKNVVLDVALRLGKLLQARLGADVVFTRQDDTFIPLETRTAMANQEEADLFVSIHANSSHDEDARGVETYYLNFTSNAAALEVAARENAASDKSIHELQDLVKKIALKEKIEESREFAMDVQRSLHSGLAAKSPGIRDRGVKKAPFVVLIGANMPSILAEISFVSNPTDARKLDAPEYRQRIAESLYKGISKYVSGLSGVKVASRLGNSDSQ